MQRDPQDIYRDYEKFLKKGDFGRAYRRLKQMVSEFPKDDELLEEIIGLCLGHLNDPSLAKPWLLRKVWLYPNWEDYVTLSRIEATTGSIAKAEDYLNTAIVNEKGERSCGRPGGALAKRLFTQTRYLIEDTQIKCQMDASKRSWKAKAAGVVARKKEPGKGGGRKAGKTGQQELKWVSGGGGKNVVDKPREVISSVAQVEDRQVVGALPVYKISVKFTNPDPSAIANVFRAASSLKDSLLYSEYGHLSVQKGFDDLLCLGEMKDVERYWYQIGTVKKVLKYFRGRVLLCDEVGLGKTIEAGMILKEYLMRGMIKSALILTPAPLVSQWKEEMSQKFGIDFASSDDCHSGSEAFWVKPFILASIHTAKREGNIEKIVERFYDIVIVDEAHHLKNKKTLAWKLVNRIQKRFILLLTATPVQNNLMELYNLITLLKPGQFKTEKSFRKEYVQRGGGRLPSRHEDLRLLLKDVVIRNTRSAIDLKLPRRYASTMRLVPAEAERRVYDEVMALLRAASPSIPKRTAQLLLREVGSSPHALKGTLTALRSSLGPGVEAVARAIDGLGDLSKGRALMDITRRNPGEKKVIFTQYLKSMDYITSLLDREGLAYVRFRGDMGSKEKDESIARFREGIPLLVSTESGGEGRNLQFCNTIVNFDLPWNPMKIEQRIGRLHRIGQTRDVFVFNLATRDTIEDHVIDILDSKINMFEMVIGEIEPILGHLGEDREFEDVIMEIWMNSNNGEELRNGFEKLGEKLVEAKSLYLKTKETDRNIFGEDYEI